MQSIKFQVVAACDSHHPNVFVIDANVFSGTSLIW